MTKKKEIKITDFKELNLLKAFSKKEALERFFPLIKKHTVLGESWGILEDYKKYFAQYPERLEINFETFSKWFASSKSTWKEEKLTYHLKILENASAADEDACAELLQHYSRLDTAARVRDTAERYIQGSVPDLGVAVASILDEHSKSEAGYLKEKEEDLFIPGTAEFLVADLMGKGKGLNWSLNLLNKSLGPMHLGDLGCIMARPNAGKTTLLVQELLNFLIQLEDGAKCIVFNNEEKGSKIQAYAYKNALKRTLVKIAANPAGATTDFELKLGKRKFYVDDQTNTMWGIERVLERVRPKLIGFNLLCKVQAGAKRDADDREITTKLFRWARDLARKYDAAVVATHQADTSAEGEKYLNQQQMFGNKTEAPGELDVFIGIGRTFDTASITTRYLSIPKSKQPHSAGMDPMMREGPLGDVHFDGDISTFKDK